MKKNLTSRAWWCLDLQPCLSQLPKVSVRKWNLRVYGSPSLITSLYSSPPKAILPLCIAQGCDLASSGARNEFLVGHCCWNEAAEKWQHFSSSSWEQLLESWGLLRCHWRGKNKFKKKTLHKKSLHRGACSSKKQSHEDLTESLNCLFIDQKSSASPAEDWVL